MVQYLLKAACHTFIISARSPSDAAVCAISSALCQYVVVMSLGCGDVSDHQVHVHEVRGAYNMFLLKIPANP